MAGGKACGAERVYDNETILERDLNLKIAQFMREEFANYRTPDGQDINVYLTREGNDTNPSLAERVDLGKSTDSELVVSLHINARPLPDVPMKGAMVIVTNSNVRGFYQLEDTLGKMVLEELAKLGISVVGDGPFLSGRLEGGLLRRCSESKWTYKNGELADYYGIIRNGIEKGIPSIIIEHCFLDDENDYRNFLSLDEKLRNLAIADVNAIARYYGLVLR